MRAKSHEPRVMKIKLRKGDTVVVRTGKYKGQTGKITATHPTLNAVTVGINVFKKHIKPNRLHPQGDIVEVTKPIAVSKVSAYEPTSKKASKIATKTDAKGAKTRIFKSSGKEIK
jgi:large subunit ribosomal protein L24